LGLMSEVDPEAVAKAGDGVKGKGLGVKGYVMWSWEWEWK